MKLRDRLLLFSTAQLLVFGVVFAVAYAVFDRSVLPMFESLLATKTERLTRMVSADLEVPLGAEDKSLLSRAVNDVLRDPDFAYLKVRNARGEIVFASGTAPHEVFQGPEERARAADGAMSAWATVSLEGVPLGAVELAYSTARVDALQGWARRIALGTTLLWLAALAYTLYFARAFVAPIRAMMVFSRKVAGGALSERLTVAAQGELGELRDYLNQMTADLERREAERKAAAVQAEAMQRELLTVSRLAGMAEIATGVLHNVGNVLNSLNISVSTISDQVRGSRLDGLSRSMAMIESFPGGLAGFLATEKGKVLPTYLTTVTRQLGDEQARVLEELASVNRSVDHIKAIVAMQQAYARPVGVHEPVALSALLDDALQLGEPSFTRHGIEVVKNYEPTPALVSDRHKLLQIMINLISNARHALKDRPDGPHQLTVGIHPNGAGVEITVRDTGVGIPKENLEKIFQHGFTTKVGGHGFGLHASANTARELGGQLHVASEGPGQGATFTLELPLAARAEAA